MIRIIMDSAIVTMICEPNGKKRLVFEPPFLVKMVDTNRRSVQTGKHNHGCLVWLGPGVGSRHPRPMARQQQLIRVETVQDTVLNSGATVPPSKAARAACFHCGEPCPDDRYVRDDHWFCCQGCLFVHDLLAESGLTHFYDLSRHPGVKVRQRWPARTVGLPGRAGAPAAPAGFHRRQTQPGHLPHPGDPLRRLRLAAGEPVPAAPGHRQSQVNFPRREVAISFDPDKIALSELVALLVSIGYEPQLTLGELEQKRHGPAAKTAVAAGGRRRVCLWQHHAVQPAVYLGLDSLSGPLFQTLFG